MSNINDIKLSPKQTLIALLFISLIVVSLVLRLYFSSRAIELAGSNFIVANDTTVVVVYNSDIYRLDSNGNIKQKIAFADIGIGNKVADIQLLDKNRFVIGDWDNKKILLCSFKNIECSSLTRELGKKLGDFFKFHYHESKNEIFIADTDRHRILHYDNNTHIIKTISNKKQFIYPNHLQLEHDGYLYVTDTNHHRIASFEHKNEKLEQVGENFMVTKEISSKKFPIHYVTLKNGDMYILQGNDFLLYADLIYLPVSGIAKNIILNKGADITAATSMGSNLLISDRELFLLYSLDLFNHEITEFGSDELKKIFKNDKDTTDLWNLMSTLMLALMIFFIICVVVFIVYLSKKGKSEPKKEEATTAVNSNLPPIIPGQLIWLDPNPFMRKVLLALFVLIICMAGLMYAMIDLLGLDFTNIEEGTTVQRLYNATTLMGLTLVVVLVNAIHNIYYQIGTDGLYIYVKTIFTKKKFEPNKVLYNKQYILNDSLVIPYRNNIQQYFHNKEQFESYISPLLEFFGKKITLIQIMKHMLFNPGGMAIFNTISFSFIIYMMIDAGILFS